MDSVVLLKIVFLIANFVILFFIYSFFVLRVREINKKHIRYTSIEDLSFLSKKINRITLFIFIALFISIVFITLKIF